MSNSKQHYHLLLKKIHCKSNEAIIIKVSEAIQPATDMIATYFYNTMLNNAKSAHFINHDIVKIRLHQGMSNWINKTLLYKTNDEMIAEYIAEQLQVGHVHGRIGLPISLINYGMYLIKEESTKALKESLLDLNELSNGLIIVNQLLDIGLSLINESYQGDVVFNEKEAKAFKLQFSTHNLAFDCERLCTSLSNWMRELLLNTQQEKFDFLHTPTLRHSDFGLWVTHKAKLFLSHTEYELLLKLLNSMDEAMTVLINEFNQPEKRKGNLITLNISVSRALWVMSDIAKEIIYKDNGRDPLTHLFNRRYLNTVLRHETECSLQRNLIFGLVMIDIDFFKKINDTFGHDNGDVVLAQLADILMSQVRAGDFVFRLGGEEFLIVLSDIDKKVLERIGNKLRLEVENTKFILRDEREISLTVSIGAAMHDAHPDFQRTLKRTDDALYEAKRNGRNQVVVAKSLNTYVDFAQIA